MAARLTARSSSTGWTASSNRSWDAFTVPPYEYPLRHWELDEAGQPTQKIIERRRGAKFITPIPKPKKHKAASKQPGFVFDGGRGFRPENSNMTRLRSSMKCARV